MSKSVEEIVNLWRVRQNKRDPIINAMRKVQNAYDGDLIVPMPEMEMSSAPAVANNILTGIDKYGALIGGTTPSLYYEPLIPTQQRSINRAELSRKANLAWWEQNRMPILDRYRARQYVAYGNSPVWIKPDFDMEIPRWETRNPLTAFPAETGDPTSMRPTDCIFMYERSAGFIRSMWPDTYSTLRRKATQGDDDMINVVEYVDDTEWVTIAVGDDSRAERTNYLASAYNHGADGYTGSVLYAVLDRTPNKLDMCPVVMPNRITLGRSQGQFDQAISIYKARAQLQGLELISVEKTIFKDAYLVSRPNEQAKFVAGPFDGRTGQVNIVEGGVVEYVGGEPNAQTNIAIDRLERNERVMTGIAPEMGGESQTNVRTGRRGDSIMSTQIDPIVAEAQTVFEASKVEENKIAMAVARKYFGRKSKSFYVDWKGAKGPIDYIPARDFDTDRNKVVYPMSGMSQQSLIIETGQMLGEELISKRTAQDLNPLIGDAEFERDWILKEKIEGGLIAAFLGQLQQGTIPIADGARIADLVASNKYSFAEAIAKVQEEAQKRQAADTTAGPGAPEAPVDPMSPEAQPGLAEPGMGAEAGIAPPPEAQTNLTSILNTLRRGQHMTPAEKGAA